MKQTTYANRGAMLENLISYANEQYKSRGVAIIDKVPTPVTMLKDGHGFFKGKSTVDYTGALAGGQFVCFDAKETADKNKFPLQNVHLHQMKYMQGMVGLGGLAFLIVGFKSFQGGDEKFFRLGFWELLEYWNYYQGHRGKRGAASIAAKDFKTEVQQEPGYVLHYLKGLI